MSALLLGSSKNVRLEMFAFGENTFIEQSLFFGGRSALPLGNSRKAGLSVFWWRQKLGKINPEKLKKSTPEK